MYHSATSRMPLGCFSQGAGTRAMSPKAVPPKLARIARSLSLRKRSASRAKYCKSASLTGPNSSRLSSTRSVVVVDRLLAGDAVEIEPALGHPSAGRNARVALGIEQDVAVGVGHGVEPFGHEHGRAVEGGPRLPAGVLEAEHVPPPAQGNDVHPQGLLQIGGDLAQHLIRLDDLDRRARRVESQRLAELVHAADLHARDGACTQVQRHVVGLFVVQGGFDTLTRIHDIAPCVSSTSRMIG